MLGHICFVGRKKIDRLQSQGSALVKDAHLGVDSVWSDVPKAENGACQHKRRQRRGSFKDASHS